MKKSVCVCKYHINVHACVYANGTCLQMTCFGESMQRGNKTLENNYAHRACDHHIRVSATCQRLNQWMECSYSLQSGHWCSWYLRDWPEQMLLSVLHPPPGGFVHHCQSLSCTPSVHSSPSASFWVSVKGLLSGCWHTLCLHLETSKFLGSVFYFII